MPEASNKSVSSPHCPPPAVFTLGPRGAGGAGSVLCRPLPITVPPEPTMCHLLVLNSVPVSEHLPCAPRSRHPGRPASHLLAPEEGWPRRKCVAPREGHVAGPLQLDVTSALWEACSSRHTLSYTLPSSPCTPAHPVGPEVLDAPHDAALRSSRIPGPRSCWEDGMCGGFLARSAPSGIRTTLWTAGRTLSG